MASRRIEIEIVGDERDLSRSFGRAAKDADTFAGRLTGKVGHGLATVGKAAGVAGLALGAAFAGVVKVGVDSLIEHEKASAQTAAVLKSTGGAAGVTQQQIEELADSIEKMSGLDDLAVQAGQNLLLTFTNIKNEAGAGNDVFTQTTKIMADMSVALGQDTKSSAIQLGKALNDPIKGVTALQRVGVSFTQAQRDQIKALVEAGNTMGAQKLILAELTKEFGGSAQAAGETLGGRLQILKARLEEVAEKVAARVLPIFESLVAWVSDHWPQIEQVLEVVFVAIGTVIETVLKPALQAAIDAGQWLVEKTREHWDQIKQAVSTVLDTVRTVIQTFVDVVKGIWERWGDQIKNVASRAWAFIKTTIENALDVIRGIVKTISALIRGDWGEAWNGIKQVASAVLDQIKTIITTAWATFRSVAETLGRKVWEGLKAGIDALVTLVSGVLGDVRDAITGFFDRIFSAAKSLGTKLKDGVVDGVTGVVGKVGDFIADIPEKIGSFATDVFDAAKRLGGKLLDGIGDGLAALGNKLAGWVKAPINAVIGAWNKIGIPGFKVHIPLPGPVPDINFGVPGISLPDIPLLADGTPSFRGGLAIVGERGPELVDLPRGARVWPNGTGPGPVSVVQHIYADGAIGRDPAALARATTWNLRTALR